MGVLPCALLAAGTLTIIACWAPPYVYPDQALQLNGVQAWTKDEVPFPNILAAPDPADLTLDRHQWEIWHPPGFPLLVAGLGWLGLLPPATIHLLAGLCFVGGCAGWSLWALRFPLPRWLHLAMPLLLPGIRYGNDNLVHFHAEAFLFAATPWVLLGALNLHGKKEGGPKWRAVLLFGASLGLLPLLKYSGLFLVLSVLLFLAETRPQGRWLILAMLALLPLAVLSLLNRQFGGAENLVIASFHPHLALDSVLHLAGTLPLGVADSGQVLEAFFLAPSRERFPHPWIVPLLGLPGLYFLLRLMPDRPLRPPERLLAVMVLTHLVLLFLAWTLCTGIGYDRRYLAPGGLALLPWALARLLGPRPARIAPLFRTLFLLVYIALPVAYGYGTLALKVRAALAYQPGFSGLGDPLLAPCDGAGSAARLNGFVSSDTVWYLPEPILALDLHGHKILGHPDWSGTRDEERYRTSRPLRLLALAPSRTATDPVAILRRTFPQSCDWQRHPLPGANYDLWTARLAP